MKWFPGIQILFRFLNEKMKSVWLTAQVVSRHTLDDVDEKLTTRERVIRARNWKEVVTVEKK